MALPTKELSWDFNVNLTCSAGSDSLYTHRNNWFNIKQALCSGTTPWTVISSSDGSTAAAGDLWTTTGSINWDSGNKSWILLKQTGISSDFQVVFSCDYSGYTGGRNEPNNTGRMQIVVSNTSGFTGGNVSSRPTAVDEHIIADRAPFPFQTASPYQSVVHVMKSTDGSANHIFIMYGSQCPSWIMFQKPTDTPAAWTAPAVYHASTTNNGGLTVLNYNNFYQNPTLAGRILSTNLGPGTYPKYGLYMTTEGMVDGALGEYFGVPNELDNSYPITPIGLTHTAEVGIRGRHGRLKDVWYGQASVPPAFVGATYPSDNSKQFIQIGHFVFPWNGSTPIIG